MNKKIELSIFIAIAGVLFLVCVIPLLLSDKEGPVIKFDSNEKITYTEGQGDDVLLSGVKAVDKKDGDVTDTLIVAGKVEFADGQSLKITYAAKDKKNNITKVDRIVSYIPVSDDALQNEGENTAGNNGDNKQENTDGQNKESGIETTSANEETSGKTPEDTGVTGEIDKAAADASGIPVIKLNAAEGSITVGQNFNAISYVRETYDNSGDVSRRIRVIGDYDIKKPGDYQITFVVSDTEGNDSKPAVFTLHVLPKAENTQNTGNSTNTESDTNAGDNANTENNANPENNTDVDNNTNTDNN